MKQKTLILAALVAAAGVVVYFLVVKPAAAPRPAGVTADEWWEAPAGEILTEWLT